MSALASRLAKLESKLGNRRGRVIVVRSNGPATNDEIDAFLAAQDIGYSPRGNDLVAIICFLSGPLPNGIEITSITEMVR